ncbi:hypothetical protein E8E13_009026 [Curvularia kusanoi]|uniref:Uncharacterized protein n=1 Tax=Curvularia kusanoi TaxID=90978 RepID=A0A9P4W9C0_CURKU|nr:hypothetical protein E8E13_009026 [Curvularia kusanoi]
MQLKLLPVLSILSYAVALPTLDSRQAQGNVTCDERLFAQLIGGIQENMFIQKQEMQGLQTLQSLSTQTQANATQSNFQLTQMALADTQNKGIAVRERNQRLADDLQSPSAKGLARVAQEQVTVMLKAKSLKGNGADDLKMLTDLVTRTKDAMTMNEDNIKMVEHGCGK